MTVPGPAENAKEALRLRARQALFTLQQAHDLRRDAKLMAAVRAVIREDRDKLAWLLDEIGEG